MNREREKTPLLRLEDVSVFYGHGKRRFRAVNHISFDVFRGETFGIVGESGSGKTTIGRSIIRINPVSSGSIFFNGQCISGSLPPSQKKELPRQIQMIFQDPMSSLNERAKVDYIVSEGLIRRRGTSVKERADQVARALSEVGLRPEFANRFPHEFSGGQRQRIGIARALIMEPELIIADEPISALDVSIRAQVLNLMRKLQKQRNLTYIFISHDLSVMRFICDRIAAIHRGNMVELADAETLFSRPLHPYTRSLLSAVPLPDPEYERNKRPLIYDEGIHDYSVDKPEWAEVAPGHFVWGNKKEQNEYKESLSK
ncbi:MAG: ATP-binding cassette domain-containing protein [Treponema sp.]|jgi:oligopeptide transport system ATP-binding protein|nr:ATP-binding cassette domain-containing protein [Treponema sp.]